MRTRGSLFWYIVWACSLLIGISIFVLYAGLPADGATGDLESFTSQGFRVQWLLEERESGLRVGDLIVRAGGYTADEWLHGASGGPEWRTGGVVAYEILRNGQPMTLPIRLAPVSFQAVLVRWGWQLLIAVTLLVIGTFVFWSRPTEAAARLLMLGCVTIALHIFGDAYNFQYAILPGRWPFWLHFLLEYGSFILIYGALLNFAAAFPTPHPLMKRFPRLMTFAFYAVHPLIVAAVMLLSPTPSEAMRMGSHASWLVALVQACLAIAAGFYSVYTARDPVNRAQVLWIVWIAGVAMAVVIPGYILPLALTGQPLIPHPVMMLCTIVIPFIFATAILRYRLFDIEIIINRTLVYGTLTGVLALTYLGSVALLQQAFRTLTGQESNVAIVISTLVIVTLFDPLRRRLQTFIDRRFYRERVDFRQAFFAFSRELRTIIDLPDLLHVLVNRVTDLLHIEYGAVFLFAANGTSQRAEAYNLPPEESFSIALDNGLLSRLRSGEAVSQSKPATFPLLVPLLAPRAGERDLVGVLALGPRLSGQGYSRDDQTLLRGLADQAGTAIRVAQLIAEKQAEVRRTEVAEAASRAKSAFLANMSHELRTPLTAIIGYSELLQEEARDRGYMDIGPDLEKIRIAGRHLLSLISDILDFSKIEAGKMELHLEVFDLAPLLEEVTSTSQPLATKNGNALLVDCPADPGSMYADQTKVRQILLNLLGNAAKFTQQGRITLSVARERTAEGGEWVRFRVADTGIGMTPEQVQDLFQPFTQADGPATRQYGGTGLGLAISQRFCQLMGGEIRVESELDLGSTFTVRLPAMVTERPVEPVQPMEKPSRIVRPLPAGAVDLSKEAGTVLIIDDDPAARDLIGHWLTEEGFHIETTSSGEEGLRLARERHPDVITLDVQMPGMDGWVVLSALKADPDLAPIPVILVTVADDRNQGFALGASDYLLKPIDRESLLSVLRKYRRGAPPGQILIVEDDATMREMLHRVLEKEHWMVTEARNGRVALQRVTEHPPDLILLDLMMAEMDGFEFLTELRKTPAWRTIPVVVVTAKDLTPEDRRRLNSHVERILQKGVYSREELLREIRDLVATHMHRDHDQDVSPPALSEAARRSLGHAN